MVRLTAYVLEEMHNRCDENETNKKTERKILFVRKMMRKRER